MSRIALVGSFWAVTLGVAFYLGFLFGIPSHTNTTKCFSSRFWKKRTKGKGERRKSGKELFEIANFPIPDSEQFGQTGSIHLDFQHLDLDAVGKGPLTKERIREVLAPALVSSDLVGRNAVIADMLARLTPENAMAALSVFENTPSSYHTDNNFRLFLHAWAKVDGASALGYLMDNPDSIVSKAVRFGPCRDGRRRILRRLMISSTRGRRLIMVSITGWSEVGGGSTLRALISLFPPSRTSA